MTSEKILEPHFENTAQRAKNKNVLMIHDTTIFTYTGDQAPEDIGFTRGKTRGFLSHVSGWKAAKQLFSKGGKEM